MNILAFIVGATLFVGGIVLFGYSWDGTVFSAPVFAAGLIAITASIAIPFHILTRVDG